ncbi:MAG: membrane protein insertase YidC [Candidatus Zixiibacteriota bacterium]
MDKRTIIGFILIALIIILYPYYMDLITGGKKAQKPLGERKGMTDTTEQVPLPLVEEKKVVPPEELGRKVGVLLPTDTTLEERIVTAETKLYTAKFTTQGGELKSFVLKEYQYSEGGNIELLPAKTPASLNFSFPDEDLNLSLFNFEVDRERLLLDERNSTGTIEFTLYTESGIQIVKKYTFHNDRYDFDLEFEITNLSQQDLGRKYLFVWSSGLRPTEKNRGEDLGYFSAYTMMGTELDEIKDFKKTEGAEVEIMQESGSGETRWVATRTKYFIVSLVPVSRNASGFVASGQRWENFIGQKRVETKNISVSLEMPLERTNSLRDKFMIYVGPIDYRILKSYDIGLENTVNLGWKVIRPFSIALLWVLVNLHKAIPNYGIVIILFTMLMKVAFHPLTHKSTKSMLKMQELQPKMAALKERFKKDPARLNQETMKLYKQAGVNPLGGCLPLLFQMPVFWALFTLFRSTIELRQASFVLWLKDLSQHDPIYVLPIVMAGTMFWQQKITIRDPKQAALVYLMPIMFFFFFFKFPAGLTLYWTVFNILSLIETYYFKRKGLHPSAVTRQPAPAKARK